MEHFLEDFAEMIAEKVAQKMGATASTTTEYYTMEQVCEILHISKSKLHKAKANGLIVAARQCGRKPLFDQQSIDDYLRRFEE